MDKRNHSNSLIPNMRCFGETDPVSLSEIKQTGAAGVLCALHKLENGTVWEEAEIKASRKDVSFGAPCLHPRIEFMAASIIWLC